MAKKHYVWDPEIDAVVMETDATFDPTVVYDVEPEHYGRVVAQHVGGETQTLHFDALGSTREITDESETVVGTNLYDAWGVNRASAGPAESAFAWAGELGYMSNANGIDVRHRCYTPATGLWSSLDPLWHSASLAYFLRSFVLPYTYAGNSPVVLNDASGLCCGDDKPDGRCGPSVTEWYMDVLHKIALNATTLTIGSEQHKTLYRTLKFENAGLSMPGLCPTEECPMSVALCSYCINVTELGNIAFGFTAGRGRLPRIGVNNPSHLSVMLWGGFYAEVADPKQSRGFSLVEEIASALSGGFMTKPPGGKVAATPLEFCKQFFDTPTLLKTPGAKQRIEQAVADFDEAHALLKVFQQQGLILPKWDKKHGRKLGTWRVALRKALQMLEPVGTSLKANAVEGCLVGCGGRAFTPKDIQIAGDGTVSWSGGQ